MRAGILPYAFEWLFLAVLLRAINQLLMKFLSLEWAIGYLTISGGLIVIAIFIVLISRAYCWQKALAEIPLSTAYPFYAITFISLLGAGYFLFNENVSLFNLMGTLLIIIGLSFIGRASSENIAQ